MATKKKTPEAEPQAQRKPGPKPKNPTGAPMTPAERKALQRERDRAKLAQKQISDMTLEALLAVTGKAVTERKPEELTPLFAEMRKRARSD